MPDSNAISPSAEFVALCQTEIAWLREGLGADRGAVYLATSSQDDAAAPTLIPVAVYPEGSTDRDRPRPNLTLPMGDDRLAGADDAGRVEPRSLPETISGTTSGTTPIDADALARGKESEAADSHQVVLPMLHEGLVLGLLMAGRSTRDWSSQELQQIERAAQSLTWACALDRRQMWTQRKLEAYQQQQLRQRERLHDWLHQVRNPLTALRTFGKLLQKRLRGDGNEELAANLLRESERLQELLAKADAAIDVTNEVGATPVALSGASAALLPSRPAMALDIATELEPLLVSTRAIARERGLQFVSEVPPGLPPVWGDRQSLQEIMNNLLDNALKYTPAGGGVGVQAGLERPSGNGGTWQGIAVCDNGPGIPPEDWEHLFERRYRGVQAAGPLPGTGLGLAIAKELAVQMGGDIELLPSERGATFVLWLPATNVGTAETIANP